MRPPTLLATCSTRRPYPHLRRRLQQQQQQQQRRKLHHHSQHRNHRRRPLFALTPPWCDTFGISVKATPTSYSAAAAAAAAAPSTQHHPPHVIASGRPNKPSRAHRRLVGGVDRFSGCQRAPLSTRSLEQLSVRLHRHIHPHPHPHPHRHRITSPAASSPTHHRHGRRCTSCPHIARRRSPRLWLAVCSARSTGCR